ncbi:enoyl-CoA hydratase/isomerase family protein [Sphingomonas koreensis]|uniref:Enoyl-CoA hydratase/isomerase family protein n=1 Tax=Sphingomonas koreensis TaxID=93064 RepID=A0A430FZN9_9SPHN|nr:enoyl-CoA hydratase/isomerase family protein [Sphingomonas koreensis]RSY79334.1 enoyl-CoA hydratase/isomerase family protein [Sphingomonas koreensis]
MNFTQLALRVEGGLAHLTLTDPVRGNPFDGGFCAEISEAATVLSEDRSVRAILIDAEGPAFSYGGDIKTFVGDLDELPRNIKRWTTSLHSAVARLQRMDAPIVAAVHGLCAGGAAGFVAGADIVVTSREAKFVAAYAGIGFSCDAGSSIMFARRMGIARARRFLILNQTLTAEEALEIGLVDEVVSTDEVAGVANRIARELASGPTRAFGEIRRLLSSVEDQPLETQLELEAQALARSAATADAREGLLAFAQRRSANFTGN